MSASEFLNRALQAGAYINSSGSSAPGLVRRSREAEPRLRSAFEKRIKLEADALFETARQPVSLFKAVDREPTPKIVSGFRQAAWNIGLAPLLWIVTPTEIRIFDAYDAQQGSEIGKALQCYSLNDSELANKLRPEFGRFVTESGAFWSGSHGRLIDRRQRVDRELLDDLRALESQLIEVTPVNGHRGARDFAQKLIGRCIFTRYLADRGIADRLMPVTMRQPLRQFFTSRKEAFRLFSWLKLTFNGDLFPIENLQAERALLCDGHLTRLRLRPTSHV